MHTRWCRTSGRLLHMQLLRRQGQTSMLCVGIASTQSRTAPLSNAVVYVEAEFACVGNVGVLLVHQCNGATDLLVSKYWLTWATTLQQHRNSRVLRGRTCTHGGVEPPGAFCTCSCSGGKGKRAYCASGSRPPRAARRHTATQWFTEKENSPSFAIWASCWCTSETGQQTSL